MTKDMMIGVDLAKTVRIPIEAGQGFRREAGHRSDAKPATLQGRLRVLVRVSN